VFFFFFFFSDVTSLFNKTMLKQMFFVTKVNSNLYSLEDGIDSTISAPVARSLFFLLLGERAQI